MRFLSVLLISALTFYGFNLASGQCTNVSNETYLYWGPDNCGDVMYEMVVRLDYNTYDLGTSWGYGACNGGYWSCLGGYVDQNYILADYKFYDDGGQDNEEMVHWEFDQWSVSYENCGEVIVMLHKRFCKVTSAICAQKEKEK